MSDLTTRQAELEELRRRQIANNNAKALGTCVWVWVCLCACLCVELS